MPKGYVFGCRSSFYIGTSGANDRDLGRHDDQRCMLARERSEIRKGNRSILEFGWRYPARANTGFEIIEIAPQRIEILAADITQDGDNQPCFRIDRHSQIDLGIAA